MHQRSQDGGSQVQQNAAGCDLPLPQENAVHGGSQHQPQLDCHINLLPEQETGSEPAGPQQQRHLQQQHLQQQLLQQHVKQQQQQHLQQQQPAEFMVVAADVAQQPVGIVRPSGGHGVPVSNRFNNAAGVLQAMAELAQNPQLLLTVCLLSKAVSTVQCKYGIPTSASSVA